MTQPIYSISDAWKKECKESEEKFELQMKFCKDNGLPCFFDKFGSCVHCSHNVWLRTLHWDCANKHITSCPYCNYSYYD